MYLFSFSFVRLPWLCSKHKRYWNTYKQLTSKSIWAINTLNKTVCKFMVCSAQNKAALFTPFDICWASRPVSFNQLCSAPLYSKEFVAMSSTASVPLSVTSLFRVDQRRQFLCSSILFVIHVKHGVSQHAKNSGRATVSWRCQFHSFCFLAQFPLSLL